VLSSLQAEKVANRD